jgi:hypothetical protein
LNENENEKMDFLAINEKSIEGLDYFNKEKN